MSLSLLYLSEDYAASKVHHELLKRLAYKGLNIDVFTVVRLVDKINDIRTSYLDINYNVAAYTLEPIYENFYRYIFGLKKRIKLNKLLSLISIEATDIIHAATLFSEGSIAYELYKRYRIPYTVAVRGTDIDLYLSKMPHLWRMGKRILTSASKIIFISSVLHDKFTNKRPVRKIYDSIKEKCLIIPNGIEDYWITNQKDKVENRKTNQLLYIGRFDKNKNVESLIKAVLNLRHNFPNITLNLVGGGDACHNEIMRYCNLFPKFIHYFGKISDKRKLTEIIRSNDIFTMVSHSETFGLVYLEALSQGLPILYTNGQGIDGSVPSIVGEKADSDDINDITSKIEKLLLNYNFYQPSSVDFTSFSWDNISDRYIELYKQIID